MMSLIGAGRVFFGSVTSSLLAWADTATLDALLSALPFPAAIVDAEHRIAKINRRWAAGQRASALWGAHVGCGVDYGELLGTASASLAPAFAIRHAISVGFATRAAQHVDYETAGGEWRARIMPLGDMGRAALLWHEPLRVVRPTTAAISLRHELTPPVLDNLGSHGSLDSITVSGAPNPAARLDPASEGRACLKGVLAALRNDVSDPLMLLHQAHAGSLMLSGSADATTDPAAHHVASQLRTTIEEQLRASTAGIAVDWRAIAERIDACLR